MRKTVVDYREFRLSKINEPRFSHLKMLGWWIVYFVLYLLTENLIPVEKCHVIHGRLDDVIPFMEIFVIPYVFWYFLIALTLVYFLLYNVEGFKRFQTFIVVTQLVAMVVYIFYPNMQDLRPEVLPRDNFLSDIVRCLYAFDTNTGVFPSLHVAYSIGIASAWLKERNVNVWWKVFVVVCAVLISLSTTFIKQHSILDTYGAIVLCVLAEAIAYGKYWREH